MPFLKNLGWGRVAWLAIIEAVLLASLIWLAFQHRAIYDESRSLPPLVRPAVEVIAETEFYHRLITDPIAIFALVLAVFTAMLAVVASRQTKLLDREFLSTHRPRLQVRQFKLRIPSVEFGLINVGDTPAMIISSTLLTQWWERGHRPAPDYTGGEDGVPHIVLDIGQSTTVSYVVTDAYPNPTLLNGRAPLHAFGLIGYTDSSGSIQRFTGFCRWWNPSTERFELTQDPDYEFQD
jgi:hypothetical protein